MTKREEQLERENARLRAALTDAISRPDIVNALAYSAAKSVEPSKRGTDFVSRQDAARVDAPHIWANTLRAVREAACEFDGIDPQAAFTVFSPQNPFVPFIERAEFCLRDCLRTGSVLGYVAMEIVNNRAVDLKPVRRPSLRKKEI